jgi:hypothetical protein
MISIQRRKYTRSSISMSWENNEQTKCWMEQAAEQWKPGRYSIETGKMAGIRITNRYLSRDSRQWEQIIFGEGRDFISDQENATRSAGEITGPLITPRELRVKSNRFRRANGRNIKPGLGNNGPRWDDWRHWGHDGIACWPDAIRIRMRLWCKQEV